MSKRRNFFNDVMQAEGVPPPTLNVPMERHRLAPSKTEATQSPLTTIFPTTRTIGPVGYSLICVPAVFMAAAALATNNLKTLMFCLMDIEPAKLFGQECTLYGAQLHLTSLSKTVDATNRPDEVFIGYDTLPSISPPTANAKAAIVIGSNLPVSSSAANNRWSVVDPNDSFPLPGLCDAATSSFNDVAFVDQSSDRFVHYEFFPCGDYWANTCQRIGPRIIFSPYVQRFPAGRRLQVALVCSGGLWTSFATDKFIYGHASVALLMGMSQSDRSFTA